MTPRERIEKVIHGEIPDRIPLTIYSVMIPRGEQERVLRNKGVALVTRVPLFLPEFPDVDIITQESCEKERKIKHITLRTHLGEICSKKRLVPSYQNVWTTEEYFIKKAEDYRVAEFIIKNTVYKNNFEEYLLTDSRLGSDGYTIGNIPDYIYTPMGYMMYHLLGIERFCYDQSDNKNDFFSLYNTIWEKQQSLLPLIQNCPAEVFEYGGNIHPGIVSPQFFQQYYIPCINTIARAVHDAGKLLACHLDADFGPLKDMIQDLEIDIVEAFTPAPTCDLRIEEARKAWPDKVLWLNFPSSVHIESLETVRKETLNIMKEGSHGNKIIIGNTEDIPEHVLWTSLNTIIDTINENSDLSFRSPEI